MDLTTVAEPVTVRSLTMSRLAWDVLTYLAPSPVAAFPWSLADDLLPSVGKHDGRATIRAAFDEIVRVLGNVLLWQPACVPMMGGRVYGHTWGWSVRPEAWERVRELQEAYWACRAKFWENGLGGTHGKGHADGHGPTHRGR